MTNTFNIIEEWMNAYQDESPDTKQPQEWTSEELKNACVQRFLHTENSAIVDFVQDHTSTSINLQNSNIEDDDIPIITSCINEHHTCLNLSENNITQHGMNKIVDMLSLEKTKNLHILLIGDNPGTSLGMENIIQAWGAPEESEIPTILDNYIRIKHLRIGEGYRTYNTGRHNSFLCGSTLSTSIITGVNKYPLKVDIQHESYTHDIIPNATNEIVISSDVTRPEHVETAFEIMKTVPEYVQIHAHSSSVHESVQVAIDNRNVKIIEESLLSK